MLVMRKIYNRFFLMLPFVLFFFSCTNNEDIQIKKEVKITQGLKNKKPGNNYYSLKSKSKKAKIIPEPANQPIDYTASMVGKTGEEIHIEFAEVSKRNIEFRNKLDNVAWEKRQIKESSTTINPWILTIVFDNDIFDNTDYYYTTGCRIELVTPFAVNSPINKILPSAGRLALNFSGFSLQQNIYTPVNPDVAEVQYNDRPFSAFLAFGQFRESINFQKKINIKSEISIGIVGPASMGENMQSSLHDIKPIGWQNQVKNDIVLNYSLDIEKGVISNPNIELNTKANGNFGTLFNKAGIGFYLRTGRFLPVYRGPVPAISGKKSSNPLQYWFFATANVDVVFYDATLQGGLFNRQNPYTIKPEDINRLVYRCSAGVAFYYNQFGVELENFYLAPEFDGARHFMYGRIKLRATF